MQETKEILCNKCGKALHTENGILVEDAFEARKQWGYFSEKDAVLHSFVLCEECYDQITSGFRIPPKETEVTEL